MRRCLCPGWLVFVKPGEFPEPAFRPVRWHPLERIGDWLRYAAVCVLNSLTRFVHGRLGKAGIGRQHPSDAFLDQFTHVGLTINFVVFEEVDI